MSAQDNRRGRMITWVAIVVAAVVGIGLGVYGQNHPRSDDTPGSHQMVHS